GLGSFAVSALRGGSGLRTGRPYSCELAQRLQSRAMPLLGGAVNPMHRAFYVHGSALAVVVHVAQRVLGLRVAALGFRVHENEGFFVVLLFPGSTRLRHGVGGRWGGGAGGKAY